MLSIRSDISYKLQSNITQLLLEDGNINSKEIRDKNMPVLLSVKNGKLKL